MQRRNSLRLNGYDYSQENAYFITICTQGRVCLFGEVNAEGQMVPNHAGHMIEKWWTELIQKFPELDLDHHIVMPNHFHGVVVIMGDEQGEHIGSPLHTSRTALSQIMQWFKTMTTNEYIRGVKQFNWETFPGKLWQRSYYDHIIRSERSLTAIRKYIEDNPARWASDKENPANARPL